MTFTFSQLKELNATNSHMEEIMENGGNPSMKLTKASC